MRLFHACFTMLLSGALLLTCGNANGAGEGLLKTPTLEPISTQPSSPLNSTGKQSHAPLGAFPPLGSTPRAQAPAQPPVDPGLTNQTRQALNFYGGYSARATLSQLPRRTPIEAAPPRPMQAQLKPFTEIQPDPTLSPYLNLDRAETADDLPNYFTFVRPQFQQMDTNRGQHRELARMQRQLNSVSATVVSPQQQRARLPSTGTPSRFMDTAQFYGGWRR